MKRLLLNRTLAARLLIILLPTATLAQAGDANQRLQGVWTFYAHLPGPQPSTYVGTGTFNNDGTFSGPPVDQHTGAVRGVWKYVGGGQYAFSFVSHTTDASRNYASTSRVRGVLTISSDGLSATGTTTLQVLNPAGEVIASPPPTPFRGCA